jgi:hypothetical protein
MADKDAVAELVVTVTNGIQKRFSNWALRKRWQLPDKKPRLKGLSGVSTGFIDQLPNTIMPSKEPLLEFFAQVRRSRNWGVPKFVDQLGLGHVLAYGRSGAKENQRGVENRTIVTEELCVPQELLIAQSLNAFSIPLAGLISASP